MAVFEMTNEGGSNNFGKNFVFGGIGVVVILLISYILYAYSVSQVSMNVIEVTPDEYAAQARIIEIVSGHSYANHGHEVNVALKCLSDNGSKMSFKTFGFKDSRKGDVPTSLWLCFNGIDWYAVVTTTFEKVSGNKVARLVTAYKIATDIFPTIQDYVAYITIKWNAVVIPYIIEAERIIIEPK